MERLRRTREYEKRKRERERELIEDTEDREREIQEEEERKQREQAKQEEELKRSIQIQQQLQLQQEQKQQQSQALEKRIELLTAPSPPLEPSFGMIMGLDSPTEDAGLDRSKLSGFAIPITAPPKEKKPVVAVVPGFNAEPEVDELFMKKKRKLVTLDSALHEESDRKAKIEQLKSLIDTIPTTKDELFAYSLNWEVIDQVHLY
jgi:hypothetical protein